MFELLSACLKDVQKCALDEQKRLAVGALLVVAAAIIAGLWKAFTYFDERRNKKGDSEKIAALLAKSDEAIANTELIKQLLANSASGNAPGEMKAVTEAVEATEKEAQAGDARAETALRLLGENKVAEAAALFAEEAREKEAAGKQANREAAAAYRHLGAIAGLRDPKKAREAYAKAVELDPENVDGLYWYVQYQLRASNLAAAEKSCLALLALAGKGADDNQLFWARIGLGDIAKARGDLNGALVLYREAEHAMQKLAESDPGNTDWQRDLSVSYDRVGDVYVSQGNLPEALKSYSAGLTIRERLLKTDPGNTDWQRDLSVSNIKLGDVYVSQGNLPEALKSYSADLSIAERLLKTDPGNTDWQRDVIVSCVKIAEVFPGEARSMLTRARAIATRLRDEGRLAPADDWIPDMITRRLAALDAAPADAGAKAGTMAGGKSDRRRKGRR